MKKLMITLTTLIAISLIGQNFANAASRPLCNLDLSGSSKAIFKKLYFKQDSMLFKFSNEISVRISLFAGRANDYGNVYISVRRGRDCASNTRCEFNTKMFAGESDVIKFPSDGGELEIAAQDDFKPACVSVTRERKK